MKRPAFLSYLFKLYVRSLNALRYASETVTFRLHARGSKPPLRVCLVSDGAAITSEEQFSPFFSYRTRLRHALRTISLHLSLQDALHAPRILLSSFDIVCLKMTFRTSCADAIKVLEAIKRKGGDALIIYFDGDDDLCIQWPELLPYTDLYVKKHLFRDKVEYSKRFVGKSNLTDYVHRRFGISFAADPVAAETRPVAANQLHKVVIGYNLETDRKIIELYEQYGRPSFLHRENDIVFRGNVPKDWMAALRNDIEPKLRRMKTDFRVITPTQRVPPLKYYQELLSSNICVSPFGYGEICWRDFEAVICGALIVKPDMGHVETVPNIFRPFETYVPVKWDFSDLEEQCSYYLENEPERQRITKAAFDVLDDFYTNDGFIRSFSAILDRVAIVP